MGGSVPCEETARHLASERCELSLGGIEVFLEDKGREYSLWEFFKKGCRLQETGKQVDMV